MGQQKKYKVKRYNADHDARDIEDIVNSESKEGWEVVSLSEINHFTTIVYFNLNFATNEKV